MLQIPLYFKQNDTYGTIEHTINNDDGTPFQIPIDATVAFYLAKENNLSELLVNGKAATVTDADNGIVSYSLQQGDLISYGTYQGEFRITFSDGSIKSYPSDGYLKIVIAASINNGDDQLLIKVTAIQDFEDNINATVNAQNARIDNLISGTPQPSEVVDARTNQDGITVPVLKVRLDDSDKALGEATGYGVISGLNVSDQPTPDMTVSVASGTIHMPNGSRYTPSSTNVTIATADANNPRIDLVYVDNTGTIKVVTGTAETSPIAPTTPSGGVSLAQINVSAGVTSIVSSDITDERLIKQNNNQISEQLADNALIEINVLNPPSPLKGAVGDGVTDDTEAIQAIINYTQSLIKDLGISVGIIGGAPTVRFPSKTFRITSLLTCTDTVNFQGTGINSILYLDGTDAGLSIKCNDDSTTVNRFGWHSPGLWVRDLKFASKRHVSITSALTIGNIDFPLLDNIYFWGIKGRGISLQTVRQHQINNIYADLCGDVGMGVVENIAPLPTQETSNLGLGVNWQLINNYGAAIKFANGDFSLTGYCIHGCISGDTSRTTLFGVDDYNTSGDHQVELTNSEIKLSSGTFAWTPDNHSAIHLDGSSCYLASCYSAGNHYSENETHGDSNQIISLVNSSTLYLMGDNVGLQTYLAADLFSCDSTSVIYGSLVSKRTNDYLNAAIKKEIVATEINVYGDKGKQVIIQPPSGYAHNVTFNQSVDGVGLNTQWELHDINGHAIAYMGEDSTKQKASFLLGNNSLFKIPKGTTSTYYYSHNGAMWIDDATGDLKAIINNQIKSLNYDLSGSGAPTSVPVFIGQGYIDTTNKKYYKAMGTSASTDWVILN